MNDSKSREQRKSEAQKRIGDLYQQMEQETDWRKKEGLYGQVKEEVALTKHYSAMEGVDRLVVDLKFENKEFNEALLGNQVFIQSIENVRRSIKEASEKIKSSNQLKIENETQQKELLKFFSNLDSDLMAVIDVTELSANPEPFQKNQYIHDWFENNWPEAVDKLKEFTSKKALADMLVPTGIVGAFALCGGVVGVFFGFPAAASTGAGLFLGMFATGKVGIKEASKRLEDSQQNVDDI